jgi:hypothetical protein
MFDTSSKSGKHIITQFKAHLEKIFINTRNLIKKV